MSKYSFIILDNDQKSSSELEKILNEFYFNLCFVTIPSNVSDVLNENLINYDVIFSTVGLSDKISELFKFTTIDKTPEFVLIHESIQLTKTNLKINPLHNLQKPYNKQAVDNIIWKYELIRISKSREQDIYNFIETYIHPTHETSKIGLPIGDRLDMIPKNHIVRCQSESNYTIVYTVKGLKYTIAKTLKEIEKNLPGIFFRIHRSHLVNLNMIKSIDRKESQVELYDNTKLPISEDRKTEFLNHIKIN